MKMQMQLQSGRCVLVLIVFVAYLSGLISLGKSATVVYLSTDHDTRGDWMPRYGSEYYHILASCPDAYPVIGLTGEAIFSIDSWWGGEQPLKFNASVRSGELEWLLAFGPQQDGRLRYASLYNPLFRAHVLGGWDDSGWQHPYEDTYGWLMSVSIPAGYHEFSVYFVDAFWSDPALARRYRISVYDGEPTEGKEPILKLFVSDFRDGVYKTLLCRGPMRLFMLIERLGSISVTINGIFLDAIAPLLPVPKALLDREMQNEDVKQAVATYQRWRDEWLRDPVGWFETHANIVLDFLAVLERQRHHGSITAAWMQWQLLNQQNRFIEAESVFKEIAAKLHKEIPVSRIIRIYGDAIDLAYQSRDYVSTELLMNARFDTLRKINATDELLSNLKDALKKFCAVDYPYINKLAQQFVEIAMQGDEGAALERIESIASEFYERAIEVRRRAPKRLIWTENGHEWAPLNWLANPKRSRFWRYLDDPYLHVVECLVRALQKRIGRKSVPASLQRMLCDALYYRDLPMPKRYRRDDEFRQLRINYLTDAIHEHELLISTARAKLLPNYPARLTELRLRLAIETDAYAQATELANRLVRQTTDLKLLDELGALLAELLQRSNRLEMLNALHRRIRRHVEPFVRTGM